MATDARIIQSPLRVLLVLAMAAAIAWRASSANRAKAARPSSPPRVPAAARADAVRAVEHSRATALSRIRSLRKAADAGAAVDAVFGGAKQPVTDGGPEMDDYCPAAPHAHRWWARARRRALGEDGGGGAAEGPLNVLFVMADDLRPELGVYGAATRTPRLDALARSPGAVLFERAYAQVTTCNPSRNSLMSGRRPDDPAVATWAFENTHSEALVSMPQHFHRAGFDTASFGKVYHWQASARATHTRPPARDTRSPALALRPPRHALLCLSL